MGRDSSGRIEQYWSNQIVVGTLVGTITEHSSIFLNNSLLGIHADT